MMHCCSVAGGARESKEKSPLSGFPSTAQICLCQMMKEATQFNGAHEVKEI